MLRLPEAHSRQRQSVENWVLGNKPLVRSESAPFLNMSTDADYVALGIAEKSDRSGLELMLEMVLRAFPRLARRVRLPFSIYQTLRLEITLY
jgi:hypothetical protein